MIRKFECKECGKKFSFEEKDQVKCPHCGSDNVDYSKFHLPRWLLLSVALLIFAVPLVIWLFRMLPFPQEKEQPVILRDSVAQEFTQKSDSIYLSDGNTIAPSLSIAKKDYDASDDTYKCQIVVSYPPQQPWKVIVKKGDGTIVAESEDGLFKKLPYSDDDGTYTIALVDKSSGSLLCEERDFPDFPKLDVVKKPWSEKDLQEALNSDVSIVDNPNIANPHKVVVVNKPKGDPSPTNSLRDIQQLISQCSLTAVVENVEHDNMNKISSAKIKINYPDDWLVEDDDY